MSEVREDEDEGNQNAIYIHIYILIKMSYVTSIYGINLKVN